jgi:hypothetical protein
MAISTDTKNQTVSEQPQKKQKLIGFYAGVTLFYLFVTIILTFPLVLNFGNAVPAGSVEDRYQNFWNFWWTGRAIANFQNPFETNALFFPYYTGGANPTVPLYLHTLQLLNCLVVLPITFLFGIAASYNSLILFAFTLSGLGAFLLARKITNNGGASLLAGLVYAFSVSHFHSVTTSITNIMSIQYLPFFAWALLEWHDKRTTKWILIAGLFLAAAAYTDWYNTLYLLFYAGFFYLVTAFPRNWIKQLWGVGGAVLSGLIFAAPAFIGAFLTLSSPIFAAQLDETRDLRASKTLVELINPLTVEGILFWLGLTIGLALLFGGKERRKFGGYWLMFFGLCHLFSLGPRLQIDKVGNIPTPTDVPLPYALIKLVPGASVMRAPDRFDIPAQLALAILVALAVTWLLQRMADFGQWAKMGICAVIAIAYLIAVNPAPMKLITVEPSAFVNYLPKEGNYQILELPITRHYNFDHERMLNQTYHRQLIMGGYLARPVLSPYRTPDSPFRYLADQTYAQTDPKQEIFAPEYSFALLDNLARLHNFKFVAVYKNDYRFERERQAVKQLIETRLGKSAILFEDEGYALYQVPPDLRQKVIDPGLHLGEGWYEVEQNADGLYRWTQQKADFYITVAQLTKLKLQIRVRSFGGDRPARLLFGDKVLWEARLTPAGENVSVEVDLPIGTNRFTLESLSPAQTGKETGISQDTRPLAFLVNRISLEKIARA